MSSRKTIVIKDYKKHWVDSTKLGHFIKICYGKNDQVLEIDCRWNNRERTKDGRPEKTKD
jgi:hypothetical protein